MEEKYNPMKSAEIATEHNYNMLDLSLIHISCQNLSHFLNDTDGVEEQAGFGPIQPLPPADL